MVRSTLHPCFDVTGGQRYESRPLKKCTGVKGVFSRLLKIQEVSSEGERPSWASILELSSDQFSAQLELMRSVLSHFTVRILRFMSLKMSFFQFLQKSQE